ncbi:Protein fam72a, partial [Physocladia obscura]
MRPNTTQSFGSFPSTLSHSTLQNTRSSPSQIYVDPSATTRQSSASNSDTSNRSVEFTARRPLLARASLFLREAAAGLPMPGTRQVTLAQYETAFNNMLQPHQQQQLLRQQQQHSATIPRPRNPVPMTFQQQQHRLQDQNFPEFIAYNTTPSTFAASLPSRPASFGQTPAAPTNTATTAAAAVVVTVAGGNAVATAPINLHPSFRSKTVCRLSCRFCVQPICQRGMKAILLADTRVELYSTDIIPAG